MAFACLLTCSLAFLPSPLAQLDILNILNDCVKFTVVVVILLGNVVGVVALNVVFTCVMLVTGDVVSLVDDP